MRVGCDLVAISRIEKILNKYSKAFLDKFLNPAEQNLVKSTSSIAGFYAAKEAASKALGLGICAECSFFDIEISKSKLGAPLLKFSERICENFNVKNTSLSISHDGNFAMAVVVIQ